MSSTKIVLPKPMLKPKVQLPRPAAAVLPKPSAPTVSETPETGVIESSEPVMKMPAPTLAPTKKPAPTLKKAQEIGTSSSDISTSSSDTARLTAPTLIKKPNLPVPKATEAEATPVAEQQTPAADAAVSEKPAILSLVGRKITTIREMTPEELAAEGWSQNVRVIVLDNGMMLYPSCDMEGNNGGCLFGRDPSSPTDRQYFCV